MLIPKELFDQIVKYCSDNDLGACIIGKEGQFDAIIIGRSEIPIDHTMIFLAHLILAGVVTGEFDKAPDNEHPDDKLAKQILEGLDVDPNRKAN